MNSKKILFSALAAILALTLTATAQEPRGTATADFGGKSVEIDYGRPSLTGRDMLGRLVVGQPWRMGMGGATMLRTETALKFGDQTVAPGEYRLWARKTEEGEWQLIVSSSKEAYREANDVAVVNCSHSMGQDQVETFTIELSAQGHQGEFSMAWDTLQVKTSFTAE